MRERNNPPKSILLAAFSFFLVGHTCIALSADTSADKSCRAILTTSYHVTEPVGFAEINPSLNRWSQNVRTDPDGEEVHFTAEPSARGKKFTLKLKEPFSTDYGQGWSEEQLPDQTAGYGLVVPITTSTSGQPITIELKGYGRFSNEPFRAVATFISTGGDELVRIPWENFKLLNAVAAPPSLYHNVGGLLKSAAFIILPNGSRSRWPTPVYRYPEGSSYVPGSMPVSEMSFIIRSRDSFSMTIKGPIYRDFDLQKIAQDDLFERAHLLENLFKDGGKNFKAFFVQKLRSAAAQDYAFSVVAKGETAVRNELMRYGFKLHELPDKVSLEEFFGLFAPDSQGFVSVPVESGGFATYHGRYTHAAQMLTLLHQISDKDLRELKYALAVLPRSDGLIRAHGPGRAYISTWSNLWNVLFDAPGADGPNAPLWWAKEFRHRKIAAEPASGL